MFTSCGFIDDSYLAVIPSPVESDHLGLMIEFGVHRPEISPIVGVDFNDADFDSITDALLVTDWDRIFNGMENVDEMYSALVIKLN